MYQFEYGAILKGSQTIAVVTAATPVFEYGAILKGSQTKFLFVISGWSV